MTSMQGSERIGRSEVAGQALKEAQSINKSLSALGDVVCALQASAKHIPFRNSKLTQVLHLYIQIYMMRVPETPSYRAALETAVSPAAPTAGEYCMHGWRGNHSMHMSTGAEHLDIVDELRIGLSS